MQQKKRLSWLRLLVHCLGILPLATIIYSGFTGGLGVNPIQQLEQHLGRAALYLLVATLSITPMVTLTGWHNLKPRRRALGLYSFFYASLHFSTIVAVDYGFDFREIGRLIIEKPYFLVGLLTGLLLLPMAITSFDHFIRRMGKRWKSLHRFVYLAGLTAILHYAWSKKGDLFSLSGDITKPLLWGLLVVILLLLRIPAVRRWIIGWRQRIFSSFSPR